MKRILIAGADSYIGTSFEKWLRQPQFVGMYEVDTIDMRGNEWKEMDFFAYDSVFHVAGIAHADVGKVTEEQKNLYYEVNCDLAVETARKAKSEGVRQFIYMSSIIVYGEGTSLKDKRVITKKTKPSPSNFYGDSKLRAELKLRPLEDEMFKVAILRPPMIYGEGCKGNYQALRKFARRVPVFPDFPNARSVLEIGNLCEFVEKLCNEGYGGLFFPQDLQYVSTVDLIKGNGKWPLFITTKLNWMIYIGAMVPGRLGRLVNKAFGTLIYEREI